MSLNVARAKQCLQSFDFKKLFVEELGWDKHSAQLPVVLNGSTVTLQAIAEKRGMQVFECPSLASDFPDYAQRRKIEQQVAKSAHEHIIIFTDDAKTQQRWQWVKREQGKPLACREQPYFKGHTGDPLIQKLQRLVVDFSEEENITLVDVTQRVRQALDVDHVTKRFFDRFKTEHTAFLKFIKGVTSSGDREWYASLMLNRLMFIYFIQKKGFLDGDHDYLRNRLRQVQERKGKDMFLSFYRYFLVRLFHEGLNQPKEQRSKDLEKLLGQVPYMNGGLFDVHELEEANPDIQIGDDAFEKLFDFFDAYQWHLDERPLRADNEINPDVLGYIFEKYINQKQMGAYYTKDDITGYIARNTVIPFLFDAAEKKCAIAFKPNSTVWRLLSDDPDRYIYPAVLKGVDLPLPPSVAAGIDDFSKRTGWNGPTTAEFGLPTETWREYVARRQRCHELRAILKAGKVHSINDLVTYNLDICQFAEDVIGTCEGPELLTAFYRTIENVSVLDPTCGSGAFLFAALNILEPLYDTCLERMQTFVEELKSSVNERHAERIFEFRTVLKNVAQHPNHRYFILKSIIINNLYGVDIMEEAVEICKLRLFLKLVAQVEQGKDIEPLPDIDFNIRPGNTLVGFASMEEVKQSMKGNWIKLQEDLPRLEQAGKLVAHAFQLFRQIQTQYEINAKEFSAAKTDLRTQLGLLRNELDRYLAGEYGIDADRKPKIFEQWQDSHRPFHWFAAFYSIMARGGFDVVIGNPPYVGSRKVSTQYTVKCYKSQGCPDVYAWCLERASAVVGTAGFTGMIVPLSIGFSGDFEPLRRLLFERFSCNWFSSFGRIPSALFNYDVRVRNTIHLGSRQGKVQTAFTSRLHRWFEDARPHLFYTLEYAPFTPHIWKHRIPKINCAQLSTAIEGCMKEIACCIGDSLSARSTPHVLYSKKTAYNWLAFSHKPPPCYDLEGNDIPQTQLDAVHVASKQAHLPLFLLLNGKLAYAFWCIVGDDFHVAKWTFTEFPFDLNRFQPVMEELNGIAKELNRAMKDALSFKLNAGKKVGNFNLAKCRSVTDRSDRLLARCMGLECAWEDIQLYCNQVVKTDFEQDIDE